MVTIEQKLTLFSKLLHQEIKEETDKKLCELEKEYEARILKNKEKVDKQAAAIMENTLKRAEAKKIELVSKSKISAKRECMLAKEKYIDIFITNLKDKVKDFVQTDAYTLYLEGYLEQFQSLKGHEQHLVVYMTAYDYNHHKTYITEKLVRLGLNAEKLSFETTSDGILGGIIIADPEFNRRIDGSIAELIEDSKNYIIESLFRAIGEAGGILE